MITRWDHQAGMLCVLGSQRADGALRTLGLARTRHQILEGIVRQIVMRDGAPSMSFGVAGGNGGREAVATRDGHPFLA